MEKPPTAPPAPGKIGAGPKDLKASKIMRILAIIVVVGICVLLFALYPSNATTQKQSTAASAQSTQSVESNGQRAVGDLEAVTVYHVIDGDTLYVHRSNGQNAKVRLVGMDCPESVAEDQSRNTEEGRQASDYTKSLVAENQTVWLSRDTSDTDRYDRLLRYVWLQKPNANPTDDQVEAQMLDAILVKDGYAQAKRYEPDTAYYDLFEQLEAEAVAQNKGVSHMWA